MDKQINRRTVTIHMYTLHEELVISFISTSKFFNTFSQLITQWDAVYIFNQEIWVCELSITAISILTHNIRITDFFQFLKKSLRELRKTNDWNFQCFCFICSRIHWRLCLAIACFFLNAKFKNMGMCSCYGKQVSSTAINVSLLSDLSPPEIMLIVWIM